MPSNTFCPVRRKKKEENDRHLDPGYLPKNVNGEGEVKKRRRMMVAVSGMLNIIKTALSKSFDMA